MNVYFARSIRGNHTAGDMPAFNTIARVISVKHTLMWELANKPGPTANTDEYIYQRDIEWIDRCQAMIAEASNPSLGVGYEIAYARHAVKIPVLCVARKDATVSAMIAGGSGVHYYRDLADLENLVQTFLEEQSEAFSRSKRERTTDSASAVNDDPTRELATALKRHIDALPDWVDEIRYSRQQVKTMVNAILEVIDHDEAKDAEIARLRGAIREAADALHEEWLNNDNGRYGGPGETYDMLSAALGDEKEGDG